MITLYTVQEVRKEIKSWSGHGFTIGFVPTMGYLHDGHVSLIQKARIENDKVVVSIFVNPIQFGPNEDYERYPRDLERDREICEKAGADLIFAPSAAEMFPSENLTFIYVSKLGDYLCGARRPGHFRGVCTIVTKLFNIVKPNRAYFGEKDFQQLAIIRQMTRDLCFDTQIVTCPTIRESDGLALSSRNSYLYGTERSAARVIPESLNLARETMNGGERDSAMIKRIILQNISAEPLAKVDYIEIVDALHLQPIPRIDRPAIVAVAVFIGTTRLIDHFLFEGGL
ncbi:MAG: pantoate--beta-alanine ligase [Acetivibrionales bacterium]